MPKLPINLNIAEDQRANMHGTHNKIGVVLHETVSPNYPGLKDIIQTSKYVAKEGYGIHGITDADGNIAWAVGLGQAIFWHTASGSSGRVNERFMGIEQISRVMLDYTNRADKIKAWLHMNKEINATAKLIACAAKAHGFPIVDSDGSGPGVTTHWEVTKTFHVTDGHVDCYPTAKGGYYPKGLVIKLARQYYSLGYHF